MGFCDRFFSLSLGFSASASAANSVIFRHLRGEPLAPSFYLFHPPPASRMELETSETKRSASMNTVTGTALRLPTEIVEEILGYLTGNSASLRSCALVSKSWVPLCQRLLFHTILFTSTRIARWLKTFPVPEESPAHFVRDLWLLVGGDHSIPEQFFEHTPWFTDAEKMTLVGNEGLHPSWIPSSWRLPQSVTSLTIRVNKISLSQIQNIMEQLPNLDDLTLSGALVTADEGALIGTGTAIRGRFGGKLRIVGDHAGGGVVDMLLEAPTGLHFTEVQIHGTHECLLSTVRLAGACSNTLVKLLYMIDPYRKSNPSPSSCGPTLIPPPEIDGNEASKRSFNFSKLPNLQEVQLGVGWMGGGLSWIHTALSTLRSATSPHLLGIRLNFSRPFTAHWSAETAIKDAGDDLRQVAKEVARIEWEFEGAVTLNVYQDTTFKAVSDALHVRFQLLGVDDSS